jgi:hypothetical protein
MFEEIFEFKNSFILCYGRQKYVALQQKIPKAQMWAIVEANTFAFNLVVSTCALNQSRIVGCC